MEGWSAQETYERTKATLKKNGATESEIVEAYKQIYAPENQKITQHTTYYVLGKKIPNITEIKNKLFPKQEAQKEQKTSTNIREEQRKILVILKKGRGNLTQEQRINLISKYIASELIASVIDSRLLKKGR